ncbi:MAG: response regulator transcription factor [Ignavibacteriales bacterium]|nr:response regulator transcription factor [Ignavibacteriales bacterium]
MKPQHTHKRIRILLADDHPLLRKGLKETIEEENGFEVIAEANNGESALALIEQHHPVIAVLDVDMPKMSGLEVAAAVQKKKIGTMVVILTMYDSETIFNKAMDLGVRGYLLKDNAVSEITNALHLIMDGKHYITPSLSNMLLQRSPLTNQRSAEHIGLSSLTQTERKILRLVAENTSNKEIAEKLFISPRTVETHRNNICQKLDLQGTNALLKFAIDNKAIL